MTPYKISARARDDLSGIGRFTQRRWGRQHRINYLAKLVSAFERLAAQPSLGRIRKELYPNSFSFPIGKHIIFYTMNHKRCITIIRVLHQSMDIKEILEQAPISSRKSRS